MALSVAAYTGRTEAYLAEHGAKMSAEVTRFAAALPRPSLVLDVGCGPGRDLARFAGYGHVVRGVELNAEFAAAAARHAPVVRADLREIGGLFPAGVVDGIWACAALVHLGEREARDVLAQFARLLRPGGRLYACVPVTGETGWWDEPDGRRYYTVWADFGTAVAEAGFTVDEVVRGPFAEVWAHRP